jgi:isoquinoline 1-oxidoreductase alpha subunit
MLRLNVNGRDHEIDVDPATPLLWILRDALSLTGTTYGCGMAVCGSCTVHVDGKAVHACSIAGQAVEGRNIVTIEGLSPDASHPVQKAWIDVQVPQCGYCQPGMIMAAAALLKHKPQPTDADIDEAITNICRCGTHIRVRQAIHVAARYV